jgi:hypothetical protein
MKVEKRTGARLASRQRPLPFGFLGTPEIDDLFRVTVPKTGANKASIVPKNRPDSDHQDALRILRDRGTSQ